MLALAVLAERGSSHPLARAVLAHAARTRAGAAEARPAEAARVIERHERAGAGVRVTLEDGRRLLAGSARWLAEHGIARAPAVADPGCSRVLVAVDDRPIGAIELADTPAARPPPRCSPRCARAGSSRCSPAVTPPAPRRRLAGRFDLPWHAPLDPDAKRDLVESLQARGHRVAFVGDGLNDAPALAVADLGIATGEASDLARSAAAMSVLHGGLGRVDVALRLARRASRVLRRNLALAIGYNAVLLPAAVLGFLHPLMAASAMLASALSVSLSSLALARRPRAPRVPRRVPRRAGGRRVA